MLQQTNSLWAVRLMQLLSYHVCSFMSVYELGCVVGVALATFVHSLHHTHRRQQLLHLRVCMCAGGVGGWGGEEMPGICTPAIGPMQVAAAHIKLVQYTITIMPYTCIQSQCVYVVVLISSALLSQGLLLSQVYAVASLLVLAVAYRAPFCLSHGPSLIEFYDASGFSEFYRV